MVNGWVRNEGGYSKVIKSSNKAGTLNWVIKYTDKGSHIKNQIRCYRD